MLKNDSGIVILRPMLFCNQISITQFRNYGARSFNFSKKIIGIYGPNGCGKTNLLDAIYYLCFTRSYFSFAENQNIQQGADGLRLQGSFIKKAETIHITAIVRETGKKEFYYNETPYLKLSEHIGIMPCVIIAPDDIALISGGSEIRRKFIDTILAQLNQQYLQQLIAYNKILQQRNSYLKTAAEKNYTDDSLLEILNNQLIEKGNSIFKERLNFLNDFLPSVKEQYQIIAGHNDQISLLYESQLNQAPFSDLLKEHLQRDLYLQRTSFGIHKDDLGIVMQGAPFKQFASQGQRKTLLFALKLAEFFALKKAKGFSPILILDDVFEKLDASRMHNLLNAVCADNETQVFITDTHKERLQKAFESMSAEFELIPIEDEQENSAIS